MLKEIILFVVIGLSYGSMEDDYENINSTLANSNNTLPLRAGYHFCCVFFIGKIL